MAVFLVVSAGTKVCRVPLVNLIVQRKSTNVNSIDSFITELVENKSLKWKVLTNRQPLPKPAGPVVVPPKQSLMPPSRTPSFGLTQLYDDLTLNPLVVSIESLEQSHVDHLVATAIDEQNDRDVHLLMDQMFQFRKVPSVPVLCKLFKFVSNQGNQQHVNKLIRLARDHDWEESDRQDCYEHYRALCYWKSGNSVKAFEGFRMVLTGCREEVKHAIDRMLMDIVDETIGKKSEAVLLTVIEFAEFCLLELGHEFPICYVWEKSYRSQWYSDQEAAKTLFCRHEQLRNAISRRVGFICHNLLWDGNIEMVYQLLELFLKYEMKSDCRMVLIRLFEYQHWRRDLRACSEIMQNAIDLDISLPELYNRKLLDLLLGRTEHKPSAPPTPEDLKPNKYELKF